MFLRHDLRALYFVIFFVVAVSALYRLELLYLEIFSLRISKGGKIDLNILFLFLFLSNLLISFE